MPPGSCTDSMLTPQNSPPQHPVPPKPAAGHHSRAASRSAEKAGGGSFSPKPCQNPPLALLPKNQPTWRRPGAGQPGHAAWRSDPDPRHVPGHLQKRWQRPEEAHLTSSRRWKPPLHLLPPTPAAAASSIPAPPPRPPSGTAGGTLTG